jgi:hypothetical protein
VNGQLSPYAGKPLLRWPSITEQLLAQHPLDSDEIVEVVRLSWDAIFETRIGPSGFRIGSEIEPQPQIMGFFLHELIPLEFQKRYPEIWRRQVTKTEKDMVHVPDAIFSVEIKTSSHKSQVFGNRSYGQPPTKSDVGRKGKSGYYLTVNFEKFGGATRPELQMVRFGWIDHDDWIAQQAATGQSARLRPEAYEYKLRALWP